MSGLKNAADSAHAHTLKSIDTSLAVIGQRYDGIVEVRFKKDEYNVDVKHILEICEAQKKLVEQYGVSSPFLLVVAGRYGLMTREARELDLFDRSISLRLKKVALALPSLHKRLLGKFFFKMKKNKPTFDYKIFSEEEKALEWLKIHQADQAE